MEFFNLVGEFFNFCLNVILCTLFVNFILGLVNHYHQGHQEEFDSLKEKLVSMIHFIKEEQHGDVIYWFDAHSNVFLAQGKNTQELIDAVKVRFPTHVFIDEKMDRFVKAPDWTPQPVEILKRDGVTDLS